MFKIMLRRLRSKRWMTASLLCGIILLMATVSSFPMYKNAALNHMISEEYKDYHAKNGKWPSTLRLSLVVPQKEDRTILSEATETVESFYEGMGVTKRETVCFFATGSTSAASYQGRLNLDETKVRVGFYSNLEEHITTSFGNLFSENGHTEEGYIEAMVSEDTMVSSDMLVGEVYELSKLTGKDGEKLKFKVIGVFVPLDETDPYWQMVDKKANQLVLMKEQVFRDEFLSETIKNVSLTGIYNLWFEYSDLDAKRSEQLVDYTEYLINDSEYATHFATPAYLSIMESFNLKKLRVETTLFMMMVPVFFLLCAFISMVVTKLFELDGNEISVMKSRGASTKQLFVMYLYQNILLTLVGMVIGVPLGMIFANLLGATRSFLEFTSENHLSIRLTGDVMLFIAAALVANIIVMTAPAIKHSGLSIVRLKQKKVKKSRPAWKKFFLDVILIAVSLYSYFLSTSKSDLIGANVIAGTVTDPLIYLSSSLFITGCGLFFIRIRPYIIKFINLVGRKRWKPAEYIFFTESTRNVGKEDFIILFMILSISLGMLHATIARTILDNAVNDTSYKYSSDIRMKEKWEDNTALLEEEEEDFGVITVFEPDYDRFRQLESVEAYTKVIQETATPMNMGKNQTKRFSVMGIQTKEFGEVTDLPTGLNEKSYRYYLNELAREPKGCIVSSTFRDELGYGIGDNVTFRISGVSLYLTIVDFVDYWPGFNPEVTVVNADLSVYNEPNYLIITHYAFLDEKLPSEQYEVWLKLKDGYDMTEFYEWTDTDKVSMELFYDRSEELEKTVSDPLLQGTNGILTMDFLVIMFLCAAGYLIYWIMSIRSREMLFGILRASGMHKGEILRILVSEQLFTGGFAVVIGIALGKVASDMFVPVLQTAYSAGEQILPMGIHVNVSDIVKLYTVIFLVIALCIFVISSLIKRLNITKALKLGEE